MAFYVGRRQGESHSNRSKLSYDKLEMELMYLEEQRKWAVEEKNWKEAKHLEQIIQRKKQDLDARSEAVGLLERSDEAWSLKKMKTQMKFLELEHESLVRKVDLREDVIKSLREEGDLKQVKIDMLENMLRTLQQDKDAEVGGVREAKDATPIMAKIVEEIEDTAGLCLMLPSNPEKPNMESPFFGMEPDVDRTKDMTFEINGKQAMWIGPTDENGVPHGTGSVEFANKDVYVGSVVHGKLDGRGTMFVHGGGIVRGVFKENEYVGR